MSKQEELCEDITRNYRQYKNEPQDRVNQELTDTLALLFERRMNTALQDLHRHLGQTAVLTELEAA